MEEEAAEDWPAEAVEAEAPGRETSSSTALEVEEDIIRPPSTATEGDDDEETVLPRSSTLDGPEGSSGGGGTTSLPSSEGTDSGSERPRAQGYVGRPIVPAEKAELVSVAKAMHREDFGKNVKALFHLEKQAALKSMETGLYIGWRCPEYLWDCFRVGDESKCFCGHLLKRHQVCVERRATVPCTQPECKCQSFTFVPSRPEEVGEFWLQRRTGFEAAAWRAKCRCKHTHEEHTPTGARACCARGCSCMAFASNFLCAACDRRWEEHETFFESEETRRKGGRPCGEAYLPFAEMPDLRDAVLTGAPVVNHPSRWALPGQEPPARPSPPSHPLCLFPPQGPGGSWRRKTTRRPEDGRQRSRPCRRQ
nr:protein FAM221B [Pogona vitticeps]